MKRILCFGDSNAWGHIPASGYRYPYEVRWPGVAAGILGNDYQIIEDSISGRTTIFEDANSSRRCGLDCLGYSLLAHLPVDLIILALGTNDLKFTDPEGSRTGLEMLVNAIFHAQELYDLPSPLFLGEPKLLLIGPPAIAPEIEQLRPGHSLAHAAKESLLLPEMCHLVAEKNNAWFLDASQYVYPSLLDCLHLTEEGHHNLGVAIAQKIKEIFA